MKCEVGFKKVSSVQFCSCVKKCNLVEGGKKEESHKRINAKGGKVKGGKSRIRISITPFFPPSYLPLGYFLPLCHKFSPS